MRAVLAIGRKQEPDEARAPTRPDAPREIVARDDRSLLDRRGEDSQRR